MPGSIPEISWQQTVAAYGNDVRRIFVRTHKMVSDKEHLKSCMQAMGIDAPSAEKIQSLISAIIKQIHEV